MTLALQPMCHNVPPFHISMLCTFIIYHQHDQENWVNWHAGNRWLIGDHSGSREDRYTFDIEGLKAVIDKRCGLSRRGLVSGKYYLDTMGQTQFIISMVSADDLKPISNEWIVISIINISPYNQFGDPWANWLKSQSSSDVIIWSWRKLPVYRSDEPIFAHGWVWKVMAKWGYSLIYKDPAGRFHAGVDPR